MNASAETQFAPRTSVQRVFFEQAAIRFRSAQCWIEKISTSAAQKPIALWFYQAAVDYQTRFNCA